MDIQHRDLDQVRRGALDNRVDRHSLAGVALREHRAFQLGNMPAAAKNRLDVAKCLDQRIAYLSKNR